MVTKDHAYLTSPQLKAAGLFKKVWPFVTIKVTISNTSMTKVKNWLRQVNTVSSPFYTPKTEGGIKIGLMKGGYKNLSYERSGLPKGRFP